MNVEDVEKTLIQIAKLLGLANKLKTVKAEVNSMDKINVVHSASRMVGGKSVPNFLGLDKMAALKLAREMNLKIEHSGFGVVSSQSLEAGTTIDEEMVVKLKYNPPSYE